MELQKFVSTGLQQIVNGVREAQEAVKDCGAVINPVPRNVGEMKGDALIGDYTGRPILKFSFDVAVVASEGEGAKGGGAISVAALSIGGSVSSSESIEKHSRIQFTVPVVLPDGNR